LRFAAQPWLWAVPLLAVLWLALRLWEAKGRTRLRGLLGDRADEHVEGRRPLLLGWDRFLLLAGLFWLLIALARPQWGASEVTVTQRGSDVVVVLDISNSMLAEDVAPSRLERAKTELGSFLTRVQESRIGLVFFAGAAFVQCPLTLDYGTADMFLKMADTDLLSEQGTNIGAALAAARQLLAKGREGESGEGFQAIVLVTDGEDLEGQWEKEAETCQKEGIRLIPVGVGSTEGGLIPAVDRQGRPAGFLKDDEGNVVTTHLNLEAMEKLGAIGGAGTFRLGVDGLAGDRLYRELQRLGRRDLEDRRVSAYQERFVWPLLMAIVCLVLRLGLRPWRRAAVLPLLVVLVGFGGAVPASAADLVRDGAAVAAEGRRLYGQGDFEGALSAFEGAVVQAPGDPVLSLAVGETLFRLGRFPEATKEFERVLTLTDDQDLRAEALYNRGTAALAGGDAKSAIKDLRDALAIDPAQQDAALNLEAAMRRLQQEQQEHQEQKDDKEQEKEEKEDNQQDQQKQDQQKQDQQKQDQQKQEQQKQEQQKQEQQKQEQQQQPQPDEQQQDKPEQQEQQQQPPRPEGTPPPELTDEQAAQILKALDRDEEELKRSLQKRVQGGRPRSGKRW
jgi:Ca-activated chloride channel family protein